MTYAFSLTPDDYLKKILTARVYDIAQETPLETATILSKREGNQILLKREDQQPVFSFKIRGAYNKMSQLSECDLKRGVICASAGNHAQGVALSAKHLSARAVIVMPESTPQLKVDAVRNMGGEVVFYGESFTEAYEHALKLQEEQGLTFIHAFDDPDVIAGQGTIGLEILRQIQSLGSKDKLDAVFVAIGGGGLIAGVANCIKAVRPSTKVIGVQMNDSDAMLQSTKSKERIVLADVGLFSDGTAVKQVGHETLRICQELVDEYVIVNTDEVCAAIRDIFVDTRSVVEPAGALAVAAAKKYGKLHDETGKVYAAIVCGANMNFDRLRFVAERAIVGEHREGIFAVTMKEERGSFRQFCEAVAALPGTHRSVTEFNYRMNGQRHAHVLVGLSTTNSDESQMIAQQLNEHGFHTLDLTQDELAKEHLRHLIGGPSSNIKNERLLSFVFPEKPSALFKFLSLMQPNWNISLFHYRNQGANYGKILVGIQVPECDYPDFQVFLDKLSYPYVDETNNPAYQLFLTTSE